MRHDGDSRIVDANGNRVREGLRILDDLARFVLDDAALAAEFKALRHAVTAALGGPGTSALAAPDVEGDVGTTTTGAGEATRPDIASVAEAAGGRVAEGLRALEEMTKLAGRAEAATTIEGLRYRAYGSVARLVAGLRRCGPAGWRVNVLLTEAACRRPWREVLDASIAGGADAIQVREKDLSDRDLLDRVRAVIEVARPAGVAVIVNDRPDIAAAAGADGVHLGQDDFPVEDARAVVGGLAIVGGSAHDLDEAARLVAAGCDYCGIGRFTTSRTKPDVVSRGPAFVTEFTTHHPTMPHLVIGGVGPDTIEAVIAAGGRGVAVCEAVCAADSPDAIVADLRLRLESAAIADAGAAEVR